MVIKHMKLLCYLELSLLKYLRWHMMTWGHNGTHRTYLILKRLYYWKGLKPSVTKHIQRCYQQVVKYATLHSDVATFPMQFISMDLIGEFHPPTSKGKRYALTVICILTGYVFCIPLKNQDR